MYNLFCMHTVFSCFDYFFITFFCKWCVWINGTPHSILMAVYDFFYLWNTQKRSALAPVSQHSQLFSCPRMRLFLLVSNISIKNRKPRYMDHLHLFLQPPWYCSLSSLHHASSAAEPGTTPPPQMYFKQVGWLRLVHWARFGLVIILLAACQ